MRSILCARLPRPRTSSVRESSPSPPRSARTLRVLLLAKKAAASFFRNSCSRQPPALSAKTARLLALLTRQLSCRRRMSLPLSLCNPVAHGRFREVQVLGHLVHRLLVPPPRAPSPPLSAPVNTRRSFRPMDTPLDAFSSYVSCPQFSSKARSQPRVSLNAEGIHTPLEQALYGSPTLRLFSQIKSA
jgi:hypothetical protein